jgi:hypothetical protein
MSALLEAYIPTEWNRRTEIMIVYRDMATFQIQLQTGYTAGRSSICCNGLPRQMQHQPRPIGFSQPEVRRQPTPSLHSKHILMYLRYDR